MFEIVINNPFWNGMNAGPNMIGDFHFDEGVAGAAINNNRVIAVTVEGDTAENLNGVLTIKRGNEVIAMYQGYSWHSVIRIQE
jgi:hypothetical protein